MSPPSPGCTHSLAGGSGGRWHCPEAGGKEQGEGFGGVWLQVGFLQGGEAESISVPAQPLWSPRLGFGCSPANPGVVALLLGAGESVGLSLRLPKTGGALFLPGELLPAHHSPSGSFWLPPQPQPLIPLGNSSPSTASKAGSSGGGPGGEHRPTKAARKPPLCRTPGRALCPLPPLPQHPKTPGGVGRRRQLVPPLSISLACPWTEAILTRSEGRGG